MSCEHASMKIAGRLKQLCEIEKLKKGTANAMHTDSQPLAAT